MANHKSSIKRIRQTNAKRLHNRYYAKTARNAMKVLRATEDKNEAQALAEVAYLKKLRALVERDGL